MCGTKQHILINALLPYLTLLHYLRLLLQSRCTHFTMPAGCVCQVPRTHGSGTCGHKRRREHSTGHLGEYYIKT